ncbi:Dimethylaniline Monooxygenase [N-Oxide-Forming] 6-Like [Manis pentadactyla]|nr:Dimethylaniline Monooxygenase [N-Oxide-Forming] 6-Like [Manis pentadactyla]
MIIRAIRCSSASMGWDQEIISWCLYERRRKAAEKWAGLGEEEKETRKWSSFQFIPFKAPAFCCAAWDKLDFQTGCRILNRKRMKEQGMEETRSFGGTMRVGGYYIYPNLHSDDQDLLDE